MKIRDKYISSVRKGIKKHEYRLASPERTQINRGDSIILVSNQNEKEYVRTIVRGKTIYKNWKEALENNWEQDFKNLYSSLEEALNDCRRYYTDEDVCQYGIISFDIEPYYIDYCSTPLLLGADIFFKRECGYNIPFEIAELFKWFEQKNTKYYVHPVTQELFSQVKDEKVKEKFLQRLNSYSKFSCTTIDMDKFCERKLMPNASNKKDEIENVLLKQVYADDVLVMVTDDNSILQKAEDLLIRDIVLTSAELLEKYESKYPEAIKYKMLAVKLKHFKEVDLQDSFFDTLREDYEGSKFDAWFKKKGDESAYVFENENNGLKGFLYLKIELPGEPDYLKITPKLSAKKRLKIGTFKIDSSGFRLGERFLKIIFDNAMKDNVDEIYVTLFENKRDVVKSLKHLLEEWGFVKHGYKIENHELVLVKSMKNYDEAKSPKLNYPQLKKNSETYILPIKAEYHTDLFPDKILRNEDMHLYEDNLAHRYALEKIYLSGVCHCKAKPGDIVLIYRMSNQWYKSYSSVITGLAIIQEVIQTKTVEECVNICKNRSIFDEAEIRKFYDKYPTVVKLLDYSVFKKPVTLQQLRDLNIVGETEGPRPFTPISKEKFASICRLGMEEEYEKTNSNIN